MTHADFTAWHERMGYTSWDAGAVALGVSRSTYANLMTGQSRSTGKPVEYDKRTALACAALEAGVAPLGMKLQKSGFSSQLRSALRLTPP